MIAFLFYAALLAMLLAPALALAVVASNRELVPNIGATVDSTLKAIGMSHKEAALICGLDFGAWSRGVNGLGPLDIHKLARLPWRFQCVWIQSYVRASVGAWLADTRSDVKEFGA